MKHSNIRLLLVVLTVTTMISCDSQKARTQLSKEQETAIEDLMNDAKIPGIQIGYWNNEEEFIFTRGYANLADSSKITEKTLFHANDLGYSVITAICFRLAEENQLDLNQSIAVDYQDERLVNGTYNHLISYSHLLSHTSGLPVWAEANEPLEITDVPGETWNYSHLGFEWITNALETKFNSSLQALANQWVFQPLSISNSFFESEMAGDIATGHDLIGRNRAPGITNSTTFFTNAEDFLKILRAYSRGFFKAKSIKTQAQTMAHVSVWEDETTETQVSWGPGLGIQSGAEGQALWQYSDDQTMKSFAIVYPEKNEGWVVLTNSENGFSISSNLSRLFFDHALASLDWLDFESYINSDWQTRRVLESAFAFGDSVSALDTYTQILSSQSDQLNDALINNIIWSFFERNELDAAERLARLHIKQFPNRANTYIRLGETQGFQSKYELSWESYQKALELDPESSRQIMPRFPWYREATSALQEKQVLPLDLFIGAFESSTVNLDNNQLTYTDDDYENVLLKRIGNTLFDLELPVTFRLNFVVKDGKVEKLEKSYLSGERTFESKKSI